jgi:TRAP-type C4-dicarboxylate transport system substrate-binding protein
MQKNRNLKIYSALCLVLVMLLTLFASACSPTPDTSTPPAPDTTPAPEPETSIEPMELIFAANDPEDSIIGETYLWWAEELNTRTDGAITIKFHWNNSLTVMPEMLEAITAGVADVGNITTPYFNTVFPLHANLDSIVLFNDKPLARFKTNEALDAAFPEAAAEWEKAGLVRLNSWGVANYHVSCIKPIRSLDDFKGLKIRATGPTIPIMIKSAGAVPVGFTHPELYDALMKGTVDGSTTDYDLMSRFKEAEVTPYLTRLFIGSTPMLSTAMSLETWNKLSPEVQQVFIELRDEYPVKFAEFIGKQFMEVSIPSLQEQGIEIIDLPQEELTELQNHPDLLALRDGWVDWVLERNPELPREKVEEIKQFYLTKLEEFGEQYPETLEP